MGDTKNNPLTKRVHYLPGATSIASCHFASFVHGLAHELDVTFLGIEWSSKHVTFNGST